MMFSEHGRGELYPQVSPADTHINIGRGLVFSADLCYNETNKKPSSAHYATRKAFRVQNVKEGGTQSVVSPVA